MDAPLREVISEKAGETAFDGFEKSTGALMWSQCEGSERCDRNVW